MTELEKRKKLGEWCDHQKCCDECPVHTRLYPEHRCGRGEWFTTKHGAEYSMSAEEANKMYKLLFSDEKTTTSDEKTTTAEEQTEEQPADKITIERGDIITAAITVGMTEKMSDIIIRQPELLLLIPVIGNEIEKILFKIKKED